MSRYNHFAKPKYTGGILFSSLQVGEKFRMDKFSKKRRRQGIIMIKTSELTYQEFKSKREWSFFNADVLVIPFEQILNQE